MKKILLFGAGKSATVLIDYLLTTAEAENWQVVIVDTDLAALQQKIGNSAVATGVSVNINQETERRKLIADASIVISLLPPALHYLVAEDCVHFSRDLLTASYIDEKIKALQPLIEERKLLFLCEMGLDPGIDHMSAMKIIDEIHAKGGTVFSFKSHCGGLVAPESDNNPWHYKISWNPRNIVLAGKAGAVYMEDGKKVEITYDKIFENCPSVTVTDLPLLAYYPNRDSISYAGIYGLNESPAFIRTTLRYAAFCRGWDVICHLGLTDTDDGDFILQCKTISDWFHKKLHGIELKPMTWLAYLATYVEEGLHTEITEQMDFLDLFEDLAIPSAAVCSADILQGLMENRLVLDAGDRDMIVMLHEIGYELNGQQTQINSSLVVKGEDHLRTAMAKTVGLPLGIAAKLILKNTIRTMGLHIPIISEVYLPVLKELESLGIIFNEQQSHSSPR